MCATSCFGQESRPPGAAAEPAACELFEPVALVSASILDSGDDLPARMLAVYNNQAKYIRSIKAVAQVRVIRGAKFGNSAGTTYVIGSFMDFEQPAWLRVTGVVPPVGNKLFELSSDGREFRLMAPERDKMTLFVGPSEGPPAYRIGNLNLRPQEFLDVLRWEEGKLGLKSGSRPTVSGQRFVVDVDLPPRTGGSVSGKLQFDLAAGLIASLRIYDAAGEVLSELVYSEWRTANGGSQDAKKGCYPHRIRVIHPKEDVQLDVRFLEVTLNPQLPRSGFRFKPPRGIPVVHISETGSDD